MTVATVAIAATVIAGCSAPPAPSPPPDAIETASPVASPSPVTGPSATPTASPSVDPSASPDPSASGSAVSSEPCPVDTQNGRLPSDRLVDVQVSSTDSADVVTFVFGEPSSLAPPQGASDGLLEAAQPPYAEGASGQPIDVDGEHVVFVRFQGMTLYDDAGTATYDGPRRVPAGGTALRTVVNSEGFEGVSGWYIGYDGPGCVTLASDARSVSVVITHGPS